MISSVLDAAMREAYSFAIGKYFSIKTLGYFNQSKNFRNYPVNLLSAVVSSVSFPLLSRIQEDREKVGRLYAQILRCVFFVVTPLMVSLIVVAKPVFLLLFTEKWLPAVPYFQLLAIVGILTPVHAFNVNIFKIFNRTDLFLKLEIIKIALVALVLLSGYLWGIYGLLYANIVSSILGLLVNTFYSKRLINYGTKEQLSDMIPVSIFALIAYFFGSFLLLKLALMSRICALGKCFFHFSMISSNALCSLWSILFTSSIKGTFKLLTCFNLSSILSGSS